MKRFWADSRAVPDGDGFRIDLDGRPVRVPGGGPLCVLSAGLAQAIAAEWQAAPDAFSHDDLPLTRLAGTAQERIAPDPTPIAVEIARYGESDLLCYRAPFPAELAEREAHAWQPWLDWAATRYGARLAVTAGVIHVAQDTEALAALAAAVGRFGPPGLAGLGVVVPALGSLVLGLALAEGALDATEAHRLATIDDAFQAELWGEDAQAAQRQAQVAADIATAGRYLALVRA